MQRLKTSYGGRTPTSKGIKWSEGLIGRTLARGFFANKMVLLIRNCYWTGFEADLLGVTKCMRLVDIEIKVTRADLKADRNKDKWLRRVGWRSAPGVPVEWPRHVWKHYYVVPFDLWSDDLYAEIPASSGVLLLSVRPRSGGMTELLVARKAKPNKDAKVLSPAEVIDIARLANIRMWEALAKANPNGTQRPRVKVLP